MKRFAFFALALVALGLFLPGAASAQASRTWISGNGNDADPCSRTNPCKTFAGAISKTALNGEIDCLDPGGYGAVTITHSITLDCTGTLGSILASGTPGINIYAPNSTVIIRGLALSGFGGAGLAAIKVSNAGSVVIDNVRIFGFGASAVPAIDVEPNQATDLRLDIKDTAVHNNAAGGILIKPAGGGKVTASLTRVNMYDNTYGLAAEDNSKVTVFQGVASNNVNSGYIAVSASQPAEINLIQSTAANSKFGIKASGAKATIRLDGGAIVDNTIGIKITGATVFGTLPHGTLNAGNGAAGAPNGAAISLQ